ncbi:MAG TPA: hypothetical protein GX010_03810 [Erysipelotrichaceae bacterium]|nr:hypothetical protein [Erysipelotrichaceae bacterium]
MIINCQDEIKKIVDTNNLNINVADMLWTAFSYVDIFDKNDMELYLLEGKTENEALIELLYDFYKLDDQNEDNQNIMELYFLNNLKKLDPNDYLNNPFVKAHTKEGKNGSYALKRLTYEPYQLFAYDEISVNEKYQEFSAIGYFDVPFSYLALTQDDNVWMSLNPNEIETMKSPIEKGHGEVLVLGLGMGYVPYMLSLKDNVKSITIIEKDQNIISLFNEMIFPCFPNKNKINIIKDDAINYLKINHKKDKYDYIFADLWHNAEEGLSLFVSLKKIDRNIDCWLETSLLALLRRCLIILLEENLEGKTEKDYRYARTYTDEIINLFYKKTKDLVLDNKEDIDNLLSAENLLKLAVE